MDGCFHFIEAMFACKSRVVFGANPLDIILE